MVFNCAHRVANWCKSAANGHVSGGGGTPWWQPKSNLTFKLASPHVLKGFVSCCFWIKTFSL